MLFPSYPVVVVTAAVSKRTDLVFGRTNVPWLVGLKLSSGKSHVEASDNALPSQQRLNQKQRMQTRYFILYPPFNSPGWCLKNKHQHILAHDNGGL